MSFGMTFRTVGLLLSGTRIIFIITFQNYNKMKKFEDFQKAFLDDSPRGDEKNSKILVLEVEICPVS